MNTSNFIVYGCQWSQSSCIYYLIVGCVLCTCSPSSDCIYHIYFNVIYINEIFFNIIWDFHKIEIYQTEYMYIHWWQDIVYFWAHMILIPNLKIAYQQKSKQTTPTTTKNKNKKNKSFFLQHDWGWCVFFRDNVKLFMKESAGFTHDEPNARKEMQA